MHTRRFACLLIGVWLGGEILVGWIAAFGFRSNSAQRDPAATVYLKELGPAGERLWRHEAAEHERETLRAWGTAQIAVGAGVFAFLLLGSTEGKRPILLAAAMLLLAVGQRVGLAPGMTAAWRALDFVPSQDAALLARAGWFSKAFLGVEILKWTVGAFLIASLVVGGRHRSDSIWKKFHVVDKPDHSHIDR